MGIGDRKKEIRTYKGLSYMRWLEKLGISYLGGYDKSVKEVKSLRNGCLTYMVYLAPSDLSGHKVCPNDKYCKDLCLNGSGMNKMRMSLKEYNGKMVTAIDYGRIIRTNLFYEDRGLFMFLMRHEIEVLERKARKANLSFAVRINATSDLSPELFRIDNVCILDYYHSIQFYDYTKVYNRLSLLKRYENYDLTFSYNGHNWEECDSFLKSGGKVAVVFEGEIPSNWRGYKVIDANGYDMRFMDKPGEICGLTFHRTASTYKDGKYMGIGDTKFIVREGEE